ncbi:MAG TPA: efflux RND transporter periplasmic adaptor subunit [Croceibacterium sp.]|nr:efflux RND transporter periplasmic adaptor subunit [Croceibacterium sp.]
MNYEAKVADLSGAPGMLVEEVEIETRQTRRRRLVIAAAIVLALLIGGALLYYGGGEEAPFPASDGQQVPTVTVVAPGRATVAGTISATGTLAARREMPVGVVGEGGRVVSVLVEPGQWVRAGQALLVIDRSVQTQQAQSSAAQIEVARADAELAQANLDRALQLVDRGFISKADVDRLTATRDGARARLRVAEAQYRELLARNARLNIVAPAAGLVLERNVEPGQVVGAGGTPLFTIARGGEMEALFDVNEDDLAVLTVGRTATVTPVGSDKTFSCQIWQIAPVIDAQDRQGIARCAMPYDPALRPGGFVSGDIARGTVVAPRLPESAIQTDEQGSFVKIVGSDNRVVRRNVRTGIVTDEGIAIVAGLEGTERVITRAGGFVNEGDKVNPVVSGAGR